MRRLTSKKRFKEVNLDKKLSVQIYSTIETINHASGAHKWLIRAFFCCSKKFLHEKINIKTAATFDAEAGRGHLRSQNVRNDASYNSRYNTHLRHVQLTRDRQFTRKNHQITPTSGQ